MEFSQDSLGGNSKTIIIANISPSNWLVNIASISYFIRCSLVIFHELELGVRFPSYHKSYYTHQC